MKQTFLRGIAFCFLLLCITQTACANPLFLPSQVQALFAGPGWQGYAIAATSYDGPDARQYALLLQKEGHNVLCMVERLDEQSPYEITLQSESAVYQGPVLPHLLIDTGGDALFYSYSHEKSDGVVYEHYSSFKNEQGWSAMAVTLHHAPKNGLYWETAIFVIDGQLYSQRFLADVNDNLLDAGEAVPVQAPDTAQPLSDFYYPDFQHYVQGFPALSTFDIQATKALVQAFVLPYL